jgi:hypothetical protein
MSRRRNPIRSSTSGALALLTLGLSVAAPVLERGTLVGETAVESHHDPSRCAHTHDHRLCTQVGANLSIASTDPGHRLPHLMLRIAAPADPRSALGESTRKGPRSRAPPPI